VLAVSLMFESGAGWGYDWIAFPPERQRSRLSLPIPPDVLTVGAALRSVPVVIHPPNSESIINSRRSFFATKFRQKS
jgi:hypothetical protein